MCTAAMAGYVECIKLLLKLGVDIEREGCENGTPLMIAGFFGRLEVVKMLMRMGAKSQYTTPAGESRCLIRAAKGSPAVIRWLICEQFSDQLRICDGCDNRDNCAQEIKNWSGVRVVEYQLEPIERREMGESSLEYGVFLQNLRKYLLGRVASIQRLPFYEAE